MTRWFLFFMLALPLMGAQPKIYKVLPTFVDKKGRHSLSPSLYERDAYQAQLRKYPDRRDGLRFDVHWKARHSPTLKLHMDIRGTKDNEPTNFSTETPVKPARFLGTWSALTVRGDDYTRIGELRSWRATIMDGDQVIAEQKSFLW
jgi:hypothetical protein